METNGFFENQIVRGHVAGVFVILGFRNDLAEETYAQLKSVNPNDHTKSYPGELALPVSVLRTFQS